jgi:AcrR family transcriptional regulator
MPRAPWTEGAERRRQIVEAALSVFAGRSYADATTADVAREAHIAQATIFKHFATKRDLFVAVLGRTTELVLERWQLAFDAEPSPLRGLQAIARTYADMAHTERLTFRVRIRAVAESADPVIAGHARRSYTTIVAFLQVLIEKAKAAGELPASLDAETAAWHFLAVGQGFNLNHYVGFGWDERIIGSMVEHLFRTMLHPETGAIGTAPERVQ